MPVRMHASLPACLLRCCHLHTVADPQSTCRPPPGPPILLLPPNYTKTPLNCSLRRPWRSLSPQQWSCTTK